MINLSNLLNNLNASERKQIDSILLLANLAYSAGNHARVAAIFKCAKNKSRGKLKKIYAAFQKSNAIGLALDVHFNYHKTL